MLHRERLHQETPMTHRRTNRYDNLSPQALAKIMARVGNGRRRNQVARAMSRHPEIR